MSRMMQAFEVKGSLPSLNDYTEADRRNPYEGARMKREVESRIRAAIRDFELAPMRAPVSARITWIEPDMRRDKEDVASAAELILDALAAEGVMSNDDRKRVAGREGRSLSDCYMVNSDDPRVVVEMEEI